MSIYGSFAMIDEDNRCVGQPLVYQGSHVFPLPVEHLRGGSVDLGEICTFIKPDGHDTEDDPDEGVWPYLRISVRGEPTFRDDYTDTLILTGQQVAFLRDQFNVWLVRAGVDDSDDHWTDLEQQRRAKWGDDT